MQLFWSYSWEYVYILPSQHAAYVSDTVAKPIVCRCGARRVFIVKKTRKPVSPSSSKREISHESQKGWWECSWEVMNEFHCASTPLSLYHCLPSFISRLFFRILTIFTVAAELSDEEKKLSVVSPRHRAQEMFLFAFSPSWKISLPARSWSTFNFLFGFYVTPRTAVGQCCKKSVMSAV